MASEKENRIKMSTHKTSFVNCDIMHIDPVPPPRLLLRFEFNNNPKTEKKEKESCFQG